MAAPRWRPRPVGRRPRWEPRRQPASARIHWPTRSIPPARSPAEAGRRRRAWRLAGGIHIHPGRLRSRLGGCRVGLRRLGRCFGARGAVARAVVGRLDDGDLGVVRDGCASSARISFSTPSNGDGTSALTLSVMTSSSGSYLSTWSPGCLSHLPIVPRRRSRRAGASSPSPRSLFLRGVVVLRRALVSPIKAISVELLGLDRVVSATASSLRGGDRSVPSRTRRAPRRSPHHDRRWRPPGRAARRMVLVAAAFAALEAGRGSAKSGRTHSSSDDGAEAPRIYSCRSGSCRWWRRWDTALHWGASVAVGCSRRSSSASPGHSSRASGHRRGA